MTTTPQIDKPDFDRFYRQVFLAEHQQPVNVALHILGTLAGLAYVPWALWLPGWWMLWVLLFPVVHAAPGLLGHRWLERNHAVGDARWRRSDFPAWWFIVANHRLTAQTLLGWPRAPKA
jgi:hypothetical protein